MLAAIGVVLSTILGLYSGYQQSSENTAKISPQGCRMSWMSPSYKLQKDFDERWTPLARRYSLWLYREVEWDNSAVPSGSPVLFIPGNAGSSRQARSIASSASRQFYSTPGVIHPEFDGLRPLDVFTVEFNEDLSALHGPTIQMQAEYVSEAITFILALYPPSRRTITLIGHSMGGIVAHLVIALNSHNGWNVSDIAAIITMSTPHSLAPARVDTRIEQIYRAISHWERSREHEEVPVLSICGGSTDSQIPSETCTLRQIPTESQSHHRRTVYTTSVPGVWTGVGHREIVWCHQVRWRVAGAALGLGNAGKDVTLRSSALYRWFPPPRDTLAVPSKSIEGRDPLSLNLSNNPFTVSTSTTLHVPRPGVSPHVHLIPVPKAISDSRPRNFSLLIARGSLVNPILEQHERPQQPRSFVVSLYECFADAPFGPQTPDPTSGPCKSLGGVSPDSSLTTYSSQLLPLPVAGSEFPGKEGVDELDVAIYFTASFRANNESATWIAIRIEGGLDVSGRDWLLAGFDQERVYEATLGLFGLALGTLDVSFDNTSFIPFKSSLLVPMSPTALIVYRVTTERRGSCKGSLLPAPLIQYSPSRTKYSTESQFFALTEQSRPIYLSSHTSGPFLRQHQEALSTSSIAIFTTGTCGVKSLKLTIDWRASFGRVASRYWISIPVYMVGVVAVALSTAWRTWDTRDEDFADPTVALLRATTKELPACAVVLTVLAVLPLPKYALLGNGGEIMFAGLPAACLFFATGIVWMLWGVLACLLRTLAFARKTFLFGKSSVAEPYSLATKICAGAVSALLSAFLFPIQVVYIAVLLRQFWRCSEVEPSRAKAPMSPPPGTLGDISRGWKMAPFVPEAKGYHSYMSVLRAQRLHILLLLAVFFPLVGPVLVVWWRTVATAGLFAPFPGDHNILRLFFIICLAESTDHEPLPRARSRVVAAMFWIPLVALAAFSFILGPRFSYGVVIMANGAAAIMWCRVILTRSAPTS